jgi:DNA (cytosine-5)-methyltransferase 1
VTARPRLLDLFCGGGAAALGYLDAGYDVVGVDHEDHARSYPGRFLFTAWDAVDLDRFDVVHASPPCQSYSTRSWVHRRDGVEYPDLVAPVRDRLAAWGGPYVIENVMGAPLVDAVKLCGSSFGLKVRRHRLFESNVMILAPPCHHAAQGQPVGVYGNGSTVWRDGKGFHGLRAANRADAADALGIDLNRCPMTWRELTQCIPPAYTRHVGATLRAALA